MNQILKNDIALRQYKLMVEYELDEIWNKGEGHV